MRISLLLSREPFGKIVSDTLSGFFSEKFGNPHSVTWLPQKKLRTRSPGAQVWICNPYINAIFHPNVRRSVLSPVIREFATSLSPWRRPLQKAYVFSAATNPISRWLAAYGIEIHPGLPVPEAYAVIGGNHHIRMIDGLENRCHVICKNGFDSNLIEEDLKVRQGFSDLPVPSILEVGKNRTWYSETLISGTPINRLMDSGKAALAKASDSLVQLQRATQRMVPVSGYGEMLLGKIFSSLGKSPIFSEELRENTLNIAEKLSIIACQSPYSELATVQSHGDFQPANILSDDAGRTWLIDWEYTKQRQADYDFLVFSLKSRFPSGLFGRIRSVLKTDPFPEKGIINLSSKMWRTKSARPFLISMFLLEEIELRLMEHGSPGLFRVHSGFQSFMKEAQQAAIFMDDATFF